MSTKTEVQWWLVGLFWVALIVLLATIGCDDNNQSPQVRYLEKSVVRPMDGPNGERYLDTWTLDVAGFPVYAAFGWTSSYEYTTGETFTGPGIVSIFSVTDCGTAHDSQHLGRFLRATGCGAEDETEVTGTSDSAGVTEFFAGLRAWPSSNPTDPPTWLALHLHLEWAVPDMDGAATTAAMFSENPDTPFFCLGGAYPTSWQDAVVYRAQGPAGASLIAYDPPEPRALPNMDPVSPPKVSIADIPPVLEECASFLAYPPDSMANGGDPIIRSRWIQARANGDGWGISPALFITALPYDPNHLDLIVDAAWPYAVSFHAPAASVGMGVIDAKLSVVDPNGSVSSAADIQIHEVGPCMNCTEQIWRSDFILPLVGEVATLDAATDSPVTVLIVRLPRGYTMKIDPVISAGAIARLAPHWLATDSPLDINGDGIVNFKDYAAFVGAR